MLIEDVGPVAVALLKAATTQGLQDGTQWSGLTSCYDAGFPKQIGPQWEGFITNSELQLVDAKTPDNLEWRTVLQKFGGQKDPRDTFGQSGYLAAKILTDTLLELDPKDISRETVSKAVVGIKGYESDILSPGERVPDLEGLLGGLAEQLVEVLGEADAQFELVVLEPLDEGGDDFARSDFLV